MRTIRRVRPPGVHHWKSSNIITPYHSHRTSALMSFKAHGDLPTTGSTGQFSNSRPIVPSGLIAPIYKQDKIATSGISLISSIHNYYDRQPVNHLPGIHSSVPRSSLCCGPVHYASLPPACDRFPLSFAVTSLLRGPLALTSWVDSPCTGRVKDGHTCPTFTVTHHAHSTSLLLHHEARVSAWR